MITNDPEDDVQVLSWPDRPVEDPGAGKKTQSSAEPYSLKMALFVIVLIFMLKCIREVAFVDQMYTVSTELASSPQPVP